MLKKNYKKGEVNVIYEVDHGGSCFVCCAAARIAGATCPANGQRRRERQRGDSCARNQTPKPAYHAMQFMATLLSGATYGGSLSTSTLEGYSFLNAETNTQYQIYWTNNQNTTETLSLSPSTRKVYNKLGQDMTQSQRDTNTTIEIGFEPIIIEMDARFIYLPLVQR
ncbi:MAG: hypothetical protein ACPGWR_03150 [Ardenticatenaceae bacterium]